MIGKILKDIEIYPKFWHDGAVIDALAAAATLAGLVELTEVARKVSGELDALGRRRQREVWDLTEAWQGGHRERFDAELAAIDAWHRRLFDDLARLEWMVRRAIDESIGL
jgi:uncharacterized protein YukE